MRLPAKYVLAVCLLIRLVLVALVHPWDPEVWSARILANDAIGYDGLAHTLVTIHRFAQATDALPDGRRTPLYPLYIAAVYEVVGSSHWVVLFSQALIDTASCGVLYLAIRRLVDERVASLAAALYSLDPFMILYSSTLLSDTLFVFCLSLFLYSLVRATDAKSHWWWSAAGAALGLATLDRPASLYVPVIVALYVLWHYRSRRLDIVIRVLCFVGMFFVVIFPWLARNYVTFGTFSFSSSGGYSLLILDALPLEMDRTHQDAAVTTKALNEEVDFLLVSEGLSPDSANDFVVASAQQQVALAHIRRHPAIWAKVFIVGIVHGFLNVGTSTFGDLLGLEPYHLDFREGQSAWNLVATFITQKGLPEIVFGLIVAVYLVITYALTLIGIATVLRGDRRAIWILIVLIAVYFVIVAGPAEIARLKMPTVLFYLAFTALGAAVLRPTGRPAGRNDSAVGVSR